MKIKRAEAFLMSFPMPEPVRLPFRGGERTVLKRDAMLIRLTTDTGLRGYAPGPAHERAAREVRDVVGPFLEGKDPRRWRAFGFSGDSDLVKTYHAVEIAVLDLVARYEGCALSEVMGGRVRDRIKLYGSAGMYMSPEGYAGEAAAVAEMGFPAYKMRPGMGPEDDLRSVAMMREAVGGNFGLMIDAHTWWRMGDRSYGPSLIERLAREMAAYRPIWIEEPLPPDDHAAYRALRERCPVPLASGEHEQTFEGFADLIETGAVDVVQMDVLCQGGCETGRRVFERVERAGLRFAFHSWGTMLEVLAAAHLGVCSPESVVEWLECPVYAASGRPVMYPFDLAYEILAEPLPIEGGYLAMPDAPGLGVEVDERVIDRYPFRPGPWSYFRLDSPPETVAVTGDHSIKWIKDDSDE